MDHLAAEYKASIDAAKAISFDVFDTLIHRIAFRPSHVFHMLSKRLQKSDLGLRFPSLANQFSELRVVSEQEARKIYFDRYGTHEITLADIYELIQEKLGLPSEVIETLVKEELDIEQALVYPNELMKSVYEYALSQKKPTVLCSDMYLPKKEIEALLIAAGYTPPFRLFVSGELKKSKHLGDLIPEVCKALGVDEAELVHFGDNPHADHDMPRRSGVKTHLFDHIEKVTEKKLRFQGMPEGDPTVGSIIQGLIRQELIESDKNKDFWYDIGLQIFGPLFLGKFLWFANHIRQERPDKILFFARDAHLHHALYLKYGPQMGLEIPSDYAYLSRATILLPSFTEMKLDRVWHLFGGKSTRTVSQHLSRLGINPHAVLTEIKRAGFESHNDPVLNGDKRMFDLITRLYPELLIQAKKKRDLVERYIEQLVGDSKNIAILDIGWVGNMQGSFSRLLQLIKSDAKINGYYYGTIEGVKVNYGPNNHFHAYLVNDCEPSRWYQAIMTGGVELLEFAQTAPHGTTLDYEARDGLIYPIFEDNQEDQLVQGLAARTQQGAMDFIEKAMPLIENLGYYSFVSRAWAEPFFRLVMKPTSEEAEHLGALTHSDIAADTSKRLQLAEKISKGSLGPFSLGYRRAYEAAYWKMGFKVRNA